MYINTSVLCTNTHNIFTHAQDLTYAEVGPHVSSTPRPPPTQTESVEYAILRHDTIVEPLPSNHRPPAGHGILVIIIVTYVCLFSKAHKCMHSINNIIKLCLHIMDMPICTAF